MSETYNVVIQGMPFALTEQELKKLRAEIGVLLEEIDYKRRQKYEVGKGYFSEGSSLKPKFEENKNEQRRN